MFHKKLTGNQVRLRWRNLELTPKRRAIRAWRGQRNRLASGLLDNNRKMTGQQATCKANEMLRAHHV